MVSAVEHWVEDQERLAKPAANAVMMINPIERPEEALIGD